MARRSANPTTPSSRTPQLVQADASLDELRREWRRLYHNDPPRISRDLLVLGIAYRVGPTPGLSLKPGARLVREWHGRAHTVTVTEDGFDYAGTSYPSLSNIAKKITGAHWSGPRFFGLLAKGKNHPSGAHNG